MGCSTVWAARALSLCDLDGFRPSHSCGPIWRESPPGTLAASRRAGGDFCRRSNKGRHPRAGRLAVEKAGCVRKAVRGFKSHPRRWFFGASRPTLVAWQSARGAARRTGPRRASATPAVHVWRRPSRHARSAKSSRSCSPVWSALPRAPSSWIPEAQDHRVIISGVEARDLERLVAHNAQTMWSSSWRLVALTLPFEYET
jgi:hypothetical protein